MAVKALDLWGQQHDTDERAGEVQDWRGLAAGAVRTERTAQAASRRAVRVEALRAAAPPAGTVVTVATSDEDAGGKTSWEIRPARVEAVCTTGIVLRVGRGGGWREVVAWQDLLADHIRIRGDGTESLAAALAAPALDAAGA